MAYATPTMLIKANEGALDEILLNHRLSEKDMDEELFFILFDNVGPFLD